MISNIVDDKWELYNQAPFILHAIEETARTCHEDISPSKFFAAMVTGVMDGRMGVLLQYQEGRPVGVCIMAIRHSDLGTRYVEVVLVYNLPEADPKGALEGVCIPWAKKHGAEFLATYNPVVNESEPIYERRLRKYGFEKAATLFERRI